MDAANEPRPTLIARASAVAFAAVLGVAFIAGIASLAQAPGSDWEGIGRPASLASGASGARLSRIVNDRFVGKVALERVERGVSWLLLGDLGPRVRAGCPGWLFLRDELEPNVDPAGAAAFRVRLAAAAARRLAASGAQVVLVVVPDKSRIERERLCGLRRSPAFAGRIAAWTAALAQAGIDAVDLTDPLERLPGERYYRTDTHWNETGAEAAAKAIAGHLRQRGLATAPAPPEAPLPGERVPRPGDLVRVAGIDWLPSSLRPGVEVVEHRNVPPPPAASDDLFGEAGLPKVALAGTSFSRTASFAAYLAYHLGEGVANVAKDGADFDGSVRAYVDGATLREAPPRVVVWEVPERAIGIPLKPAERAWLGALEGRPR